MSIRTEGENVLQQRELEQDLDFYGELGCCLTCTENEKSHVRGLRHNVYYGGKFYDCLCFDCKCVPCEWYDPDTKQCLRKNHVDY